MENLEALVLRTTFLATAWLGICCWGNRYRVAVSEDLRLHDWDGYCLLLCMPDLCTSAQVPFLSYQTVLNWI
jgi:hypothetical protein